MSASHTKSSVPKTRAIGVFGLVYIRIGYGLQPGF